MSLPAHIGPYRIEAELGRGGMGIVYRATHTELGRTVALKVLSAGDASAAPETIARFHREAQSAAKLADHPGIVGVHDAGEDDGTCWLAMDLVEGRSLDHWLDEEELPIDRAIGVGAECAEALAHAHAAGVLHRDVKPGNILLAPGGTAQLTDFGLARPLDAGPDVQKLTRTGVVVGTPAYMPPEQLQGREVDGRADVYALGATIYELVAGHTPFSGGSIHALIGQILRHDARPLPNGPPGLAAVVARCLEKSPERRYQSAAALATDLRRLQRGESVSAVLPGPLTRSWRGVRRRPLATAAIAGLVGALGGVVLTAAVMGGREEAANDSLQDETSQREAVDLATAQAIAYQDSLQTAGQRLRRCAEHGRGVRLTPAELDATLAGLASLARELQARHPSAESPRGLVPLGRALTGDLPAFAELDGLATGSDDPFLHLWLAQALLANYAQALRMPAIAVGDRVQVFQFDEPPAVRELLTGAARAIRRVRASAGWTALRSRDALQQWSDGAAALAANDAAAALRALRPLADNPLQGDDARLLIAIARYLQAEYLEAAEIWERLSNHRSAKLLERAALARLSHATVAAVRGDDPRPSLRGAVANFTAALAIHGPGGPVVPSLRNRHITHRFLAGEASDRGEDAEFHLQAALADAEAVVAVQPDDPLGYRLRGGAGLERATAEERRGRPAGDALAGARAALERAHRIDPTDGETLLMLSQVTRRDGEAVTEEGGDARRTLAAAVRFGEQALDALGSRTKTVHALAIARIALGRARSAAGENPHDDYQLAARELGLIVEQDPAFVAAWVNRARAHRGMGVELANRGMSPAGALRLAVDDCTEALRRSPGRVAALVLRSSALRELGEAAAADTERAREWYTQAAADLTAALAHRPKDPRLLHNRGLVWDRLGRTHRESDPTEAERVFLLAVADYNAALAVSPAMWRVKLDGAHTVQAIAGLKAAGGMEFLPWYDAALKQCTGLLSDGHSVPEVYVARAQVFRLRGYWRSRAGEDPAGDYAAALSDCRDALRRAASHWRAYAVRGLVLEQQDRWADAAAAYAEGLQVAPAHAWLTQLLTDARREIDTRPGERR